MWVNNAMTSVFAPFLEVEAEEFRRVTDVTYHGYVNGTRAALRRMTPRDRGTIVQVGSALAYRGIPLQSAYCGAKHAIKGFTESVRAELLHQGSHVQIAMCHLPAINTPQFDWVLSRLSHRPQPVPPIYQPEVAARAIVHLAHHPRREMWSARRRSQRSSPTAWRPRSSTATWDAKASTRNRGTSPRTRPVPRTFGTRYQGITAHVTASSRPPTAAWRRGRAGIDAF